MGFLGENPALLHPFRPDTLQQKSFPVSSTMLRSIIQKSFIATLVTLLAGIIVYGLDVFEIHRPTFQFISTGILGSLFFFTLRNVGIRHALMVLFVFFFIMTGFLTRGYQHGMLLRDALYVAAVGATLFLYSSRVHRTDNPRQWLSPIILGALLGAVMLLALILLALAMPLIGQTRPAVLFPHIWPDIIMNMVVGIGLGTGIVACDSLPPDSRPSPHKTP